MKRLIALILVLVLLLGLAAGIRAFAEEEATETEEIFADWNDGAPALGALIDYVEAVTDQSSPDFIPPEDRVAVFDMDGTLCTELCPMFLEGYLLAWRILKDPDYTPDAETLAFGRMLRDQVAASGYTNGIPGDVASQFTWYALKAYAGMTVREHADYVTRCLVRNADGFEGMTYATCFYTPMIEVVDYLRDHDFKVYVCSGSDRFFCRTFIEGMLDIPSENIIGLDAVLEATGQQGEDGARYVFKAGDDLVRTDRLLVKNVRMNKVAQIVQEIGRKPVLSFGNSGGDVSMHMYTISDNPYRSAAFMVVADDDVRDYGSPEKAESLKAQWADSGFQVISMRDDFRTIYGDKVVRTGSFNWLSDLADEREPAPAETPAESAAETPAEADDSGNTQYVMYLGTNHKDTNMPVFTQAEAQERAKEILVRHFGGYTIQEANGGWVDDNKLYQEYTLVIYLNDTNKEAVHAAADELIEVFHQSSVLIQAVPVQAEFYSGAAA